MQSTSTSSSPIIGGTIYGVGTNLINIQGGPGCGYVNVNYTSSTQITTNGLTLAAGVYASVYGTGSCGTSFSATAITLSSATPVMSGTISGVNGNTLSVVNGGASCSSASVTYSSSTAVTYNGYTIQPGTNATVYGSGTCSSTIAAARIALTGTSPTPTPSPTPTATPAPNVAGTIYGVSGTTINLNGGAGCGYVNVTYTTSTQITYNNYTLASGVYASVWGTGNCGTSFSATKIVLGVPASPSPSPTPTHAPTPTPTPSPTPTPAPPSNLVAHVQTGDYCCGGYANDTPSGGVTAAKTWINYFAMPSANGDSTGTYPSFGTPGLAAAGITPGHVYAYVDDSRIYQGDAQYNNIAPGGPDASAEAKDCSGNPITVRNHTGYLSDPYKPATVQLYDNDVKTQYNYSSEYGVIYLDDIGYAYNDNSAVPCENGIPFAQPGVSSSYATLFSEITVAGLAAGHLPPSFLLNTLYPMIAETTGNASLLTSSIAALTSPASVFALNCEGCYADTVNAAVGDSTPNEMGNQWLLVEDAEIALVNLRKVFWLQDQDSTSRGSTSYAGRTYAFASFMLTWDPNYTVYQNDYYGTPSNGVNPNSSNPQIHVFPEEALTAYNPLVPYPSTASGIGALKDAGGTYVREYASCYNNGVSVGPCAFVVNPDSSTHPKPALHGTYNHTMVIGSQLDVLDGGTVSMTGTAIPSTVPALTGYVLLP
ncbi:MAG TPA: hypothetical protein VMD07_03900 [Candidatus Acidoferrales bacterium]|nr:hypothetical protein [Candidatus Acidoferrales bacterium]